MYNINKMNIPIDHLKIQINNDRFHIKSTNNTNNLNFLQNNELRDIPIYDTCNINSFMCKSFLEFVGIKGLSKLKAHELYSLFQTVRYHILANATTY